MFSGALSPRVDSPAAIMSRQLPVSSFKALPTDAGIWNPETGNWQLEPATYFTSNVAIRGRWSDGMTPFPLRMSNT